MKKDRIVMQPLAAAMALTKGNKSAAMLLFDLYRFLPYSRREFQGRPELVLTDESLSARTGLSFDQVRRAKKFLIINGYLDTRVKKCPAYHQGNTVTHIQIPLDVMSLMDRVIQGKVQICTTGHELNGIARAVHGCTLALYIEEKRKNKGETIPAMLGQECCSNEQQQLEELKKGLGL